MTSTNRNLPNNISIIINGAERNGKVKNAAVINYLRTRRNLPPMFGMSNGAPYHYRIQALSNYGPNGNGPGVPTGKYKIISRHKSASKKAEEEVLQYEKKIFNAIRNFMLEKPRNIIGNLSRIRVASKAYPSSGPRRSAMENPNILNLVYGFMTPGRTMAGNTRELARAKTALTKYNNASAKNLKILRNRLSNMRSVKSASRKRKEPPA
jgi:hypothetical protein